MVISVFSLQKTDRNYIDREALNAGDTMFSISAVVNTWAVLLHFETLYVII